ncbi:MAG: ThuA domain-containing protein [Candidatus Hydrogenedentota bacterium]
MLGGNYHGHYNNKAPDTPRSFIWGQENEKHPIMKGLSTDKRITTCWLYKVGPLADTATPLMWGQYLDNPPEPVASTNINKFGGRVYYIALGHPDDFESDDFRTMLRNGMLWAVKKSPNE